MIERTTIPIEKWGRDHFSTLMYIETCVVDNGGVVRGEKMRSAMSGYPTRLRDGEQPNHGDWDCVEDMRAIGLLEGGERNTFEAYYAGEGPNPKKEPHAPLRLTKTGWRLAALLRKHTGEGKEGLPSLEDVVDCFVHGVIP